MLSLTWPELVELGAPKNEGPMSYFNKKKLKKIVDDKT
jgi:hypothetical protein